MPNLRKMLETFVNAGNTYSGHPCSAAGSLRIMTKTTGSHITFGKDCNFHDLDVYFPAGEAELILGTKSLSRGVFRIGAGSMISVGARTRMNFPCDLDAREKCSIIIGRNCLLAQVSFRTCDMHSVLDVATGQRLNPSRSIKVENHVWISKNVAVHKGVMIGEDSIIASHSLVNKSIAPNCLAAGIPARVIRRGVTWSRQLVESNPLPALPYDIP